MIRFVTGLFTVIAGAGAAEGTASLGTAILLSCLGVIIMLWGIKGMAEKGDLVA
ncbi:MAG: hypothetical protein VW907_08285 [Opitutae bacterium]